MPRSDEPLTLSAGDPDLDALPVDTATALAALAPPQPALLGPVAPGTITLIRGPRGVGKSWLALAIARAIAGGGELLGWKARQAPVLYVEAAMSKTALGQRLRTLGTAPADLRVSCALLLNMGTDDTSLRRALDPAKVLVLDGLGLMIQSGSGRMSERWRNFCDDLRELRALGYALVLVDHGRRALIEDLADTILVLKPQISEADVAFSVAATSRQALDRQDRRFGVDLSLSGSAAWQRYDADRVLAAIAAQASRPVREAAAALGLSPATYWRRLQEAKAEGLVNDKPRETRETAAQRQPCETDETGAALRRASDQALQRTLEKRLKAPHGAAPRPGPTIFATVADRDILAELVQRHPQRAERLHAQFASLAHAA